MSTGMRYFARHFRSSLIRLAVMVLFSSVICFYFSVNHWYTGVTDVYTVSLSVHSLIMMILTYVLPAAEFDAFKNRRNLDLWMSSPLSRTSLIVSNIVNGAIQMLITHSAAGLAVIIRMLVYNGAGAGLRVYNAVIFLLMSLPVLLAVYLFNCAVFMIGNCRLDGIIFILLYSILPAMLSGVVEMVKRCLVFKYEYDYDGAVRSGYSVISKLSEVYSRQSGPVITSDRQLAPLSGRYSITSGDMAWYMIWIAIGIASLVLAVVYFKRLRPEKVGGPSTNFFGYTFLLPAAGYSFLIMASTAGLIVSLLIMMAMFLGYVIFRKGFSFRLPDIICMGIAVLMVTVFKIVL